MIRVALHIVDPAERLLLLTVLERAGFTVEDAAADVVIEDDCEAAVRWAETAPTLVVCPVSGIPQAVEAMGRGVWGYILQPLQKGEAELMVRRAVNAGAPAAPFSPRPLAEVELEHILAVVRACNGNRAKAARLLGIGRNTLWRKLAAFDRGDHPDDDNG
jgi:DNA-binding NtrC family response regulator